MNGQADIGVIGLAVMGQNLVLNMLDKGFSVSVFNRTTEKMKAFLDGPAKMRTNIAGAETLEELTDLLKKPRKILLMVKAGEIVDSYIEMLIPLLEKGDIIIDGGNSQFTDTERRVQRLAGLGIPYLGCGVSGGEEGARHGPSLMPGGNKEGWPETAPILTAIAARTPSGEVCCDWIGESGAGHFVKMVHNGIEYGDMQLICEAYHLLRDIYNLNAEEMHHVFTEWNKTELESYLIEITADIFAKKDKDGKPLVDKILDTAGQKGTGKWTAIHSLDLGVPVTLITEAVFSRILSSMKEERAAAASLFRGPDTNSAASSREGIEILRKALLTAKILSYTQGFMLMDQASREFNWNLQFGNIALVWRAGCIIRSVFLGKIHRAFSKRKDLPNLLHDEYFLDLINAGHTALRKIVALAAEKGIPMPAFSAALSFYDGYRCSRLPANLLQAQRDYFGAHTYERIDSERGQFFHTDWTSSR